MLGPKLNEDDRANFCAGSNLPLIDELLRGFGETMKAIQGILWAGLGAWTGLIGIWWAFATAPTSAPQQAAAAGQALVLLAGPYIFARAVGKCLDSFTEATQPSGRRPPKRRKTNPTTAAPDAASEEA